MGSSLKIYILRLFLKLSKSVVAFLFIILLLFNHSYSAQKGIQTNDEVPTIILGTGVEIHSSDESFNSQVLNHKINLENSNIDYTEHHQILTLKSEQSITQTAIQNNKKGIVINKVNLSTNDLTKKEVAPVVANDFKEYNFENLPISIHYYQVVCLGRDLINSNHFNSESLKSLVVKKDSQLKTGDCKAGNLLFSFYNKRAFDDCFSKIYSVRPPPIISV